LLELASNELRSIGTYSINETLGTGAYGHVKLGLHKLTRQKVAIKIIEKVHAADVVREVELWRKLDHPRIVRLFEVLTSETKIYLVMELADKGELLNWLGKSGRANEATAKRWFRQIASAVAYLHQRNLVHRDLKLENILLDQDLNVKLVDFGFAREFDSRKMMETYCGSIAYAAPEMINGNKYKGPEVDVWSLGVILYTVLCGYLPFEHADQRVVQEKISRSEYSVPAYVSDDVVDLLNRLLKVKAKDRIHVDQVLMHRWLQMNEHEEMLFSSSLMPQPSSPTHPSNLLQIPHRQQPQQDRPASTASASSMERLTDDPIEMLARLGFDTESMKRSVKRQRVDAQAAFYHLVKASYAKMKQATPTMTKSEEYLPTHEPITPDSNLHGTNTMLSVRNDRRGSLPQLEVPVDKMRQSSPGKMASGIKAFFDSVNRKSRSPVLKGESSPKHEARELKDVNGTKKKKKKLPKDTPPPVPPKPDRADKLESPKSPTRFSNFLRRSRWTRNPTAEFRSLSSDAELGPRVGPGSARHSMSSVRHNNGSNSSLAGSGRDNSRPSSRRSSVEGQRKVKTALRPRRSNSNELKTVVEALKKVPIQPPLEEKPDLLMLDMELVLPKQVKEAATVPTRRAKSLNRGPESGTPVVKPQASQTAKHRVSLQPRPQFANMWQPPPPPPPPDNDPYIVRSEHRSKSRVRMAQNTITEGDEE
jgi:serine/threonine protein kinase